MLRSKSDYEIYAIQEQNLEHSHHPLRIHQFTAYSAVRKQWESKLQSITYQSTIPICYQAQLSGDNPPRQLPPLSPNLTISILSISIYISTRPSIYLTLLPHTLPKLHNPKLARTLNPIGSGFWLLIALGIELPASTIDASKASSTPYGWRLSMRYPPSAYSAPTVTPAVTDGIEPVRAYPVIPPPAVRRAIR